MNKELNIGDYVRTKWGIARLTDIITYPCNPFKDEIEEGEATFTVYYIDTCFIPIDETRIWKEDIIKSSPNIIDLIEVGDYVNGLLVIAYNEKNKCFICECCGMECGENWIYKNDDIKSIVTREMFESIKYKIGE